MIHFQKIESSKDQDYFQSVVRVICDVAPPIHIPWLCMEKKSPHGEEPTAEMADTITGSIPAASPTRPHTADMTPIAMMQGTPGVQYQTVKVKRTFSKPKVTCNQK